jgi:hypothetical protein
VRKSLECGHASCLQGCAHPLHQSDKEREREGEKERERKEREREKERERDVEFVQNCYFYF